jgi:NDP-sugar pyrophosphorylase family protein
MKAMVLAAGLGTRLRPLTDTIPKALLPVAGRPLIHYPLLWLKRYGITEMVINLHHHGQQIIDTLGDGRAMGLTLHYSREPTILGTGGGIKQARRLLGETPFLVVNSDIVIDLDLDQLVEFHHRRKSTVSMVLRADPDAERYGIVELDGQDRIQTIVGRGRAGTAGLRRLMFTGVHLLEPSVFDAIPGDGFSSITDVYIAMLQQDERLCGYVMKGTWMDLGTPERYQDADRRLRTGQLTLSYLKAAESATARAVTRHRTTPRSRDD